MHAVKGRRLVDPFERLLKLEDHLLSFQLSPQSDRPPQLPALLLDAIVLDDALDACEPIGCAAMINWPHTVRVLPIGTPNLSTIAHSAPSWSVSSRATRR
jgi:hypothetical protein